jgi:6-phosphofructokinase 1
MGSSKKLAILVGGGPAPGINSVISAATIRSTLKKTNVVGLQEGFKGLIKGDLSYARPLTIRDVERAHFLGGSILGISRANPTRSEHTLESVVNSLQELDVDKLITIGGDGTAYCAARLQAQAKDRLNIVHVPKTIDNDIALPPEIDTFGFQTARHVGVEIVKNLMTDAKTTPRWYFVVTMGRKAGHLALGIGKAAGATLTLIPEEYPEKEGTIPLDWLVDTLVCSIIKRRHEGKHYGVVVLAEGIIERLDPDELAQLQNIERNDRGYVRLGEFDFGQALKHAVQHRLHAFNLKDVTIIHKDIGYELRCADPIPMDMEYCRDLGYCAAKFVQEGGRNAVVSLQGGHFIPIPFDEMVGTKGARTRFVDVSSNRYRVAKRYMIRLRQDELDDAERMAEYGNIVGLSGEGFTQRFKYITDFELPSIPLPGTPVEQTKFQQLLDYTDDKPES